jgi:hypothetical protein
MRGKHFLMALACVCVSAWAHAQTSEGGLRGYVRDEQGGALPGVTITATSPDAIAPASAVTDKEGYYRLINLKPGAYTITAEVQGFSKARHTGNPDPRRQHLRVRHHAQGRRPPGGRDGRVGFADARESTSRTTC